MNYPKVTVIIPTYNRANLLPRAIKSVLNQTLKDFELIIVDDASTDNTREVVEEIQKKDKRIKYIRLDKNSGAPAHPKNVGIQNAKGDYIAFLDHDDEWLPEKLEKQIQLFKNPKKKNLGFVGCNLLVIDDNKIRKYIIPKYTDNFQKLLLTNFIFSSSGVMVKKSVIDNVGLFDESLKNADDWDMWIRIAQKYNFDFVPEFLFRYYLHENNTTKLTPLEFKIKDIEGIFKKYKEYYYKHPKIYSIKLRYDGTRYVLAKELKKGRKCFVKSIQLNPVNIKSYLYFLISLFGPKLYHKLTLVKAKLKRFKVFSNI